MPGSGFQEQCSVGARQWAIPALPQEGEQEGSGSGERHRLRQKARARLALPDASSHGSDRKHNSNRRKGEPSNACCCPHSTSPCSGRAPLPAAHLPTQRTRALAGAVVARCERPSRRPKGEPAPAGRPSLCSPPDAGHAIAAAHNQLHGTPGEPGGGVPLPPPLPPLPPPPLPLPLRRLFTGSIGTAQRMRPAPVHDSTSLVHPCRHLRRTGGEACWPACVAAGRWPSGPRVWHALPWAACRCAAWPPRAGARRRRKRVSLLVVPADACCVLCCCNLIATSCFFSANFALLLSSHTTTHPPLLSCRRVQQDCEPAADGL